MEEIEYGILDLSSEAQLIEFEEGLYKGFSGQGERVALKYKESGPGRLRPLIPYANLEIYTIREGGRLVAASVINLDISKHCQLANLGIDLKSRLTIDIDKVCEGFGLFVLDTTVSPFEIGSYMTTSVYKKLKARGYLEYYCSANKRTARLQTKLYPLNMVDEIESDGEVYYLLKADLMTLD